MKYKSISAFMTTLFLITTIMFMGNCGGGTTVTADPFTEVEEEFDEDEFDDDFDDDDFDDDFD